MHPERRLRWRVACAIILGLAPSLSACGKTSPPAPSSSTTTTTTTTTSTPPSTPPVLSVPIVDLTALDDFLPFGFTAQGRVNPTYELRTIGDTVPVRAAGPGTVANILFNPTENDSELHIRPPNAPEYMVIYDHVLSLQVSVGQSVTAGQTLGLVGKFVPRVGRTELQVNRTIGQETLALCPREFGTADFNAAHETAFARFPSRGGNLCVVGSVVP